MLSHFSPTPRRATDMATTSSPADALPNPQPNSLSASLPPTRADFLSAPMRLARRLDADFLPPETPWAWDEDAEVLLTEADFRRAALGWRRAAEKLLAKGVATVLLHSEDTIETAPALFGCWSAGLETLLTGRADEGALQEVRASGLSPALALDFAALAGPADAVLSPETASDESLFESPALIDTDRVLLSLWTSGSTGEPKRVPKRLSQFFGECEAIDMSMRETLGDAFPDRTVVFATVTHQHIYGLLFRLGWPLLGRGLVTRRRHHFPEMLAKAMEAAPSVDGRPLPILLISSPAHLARFTVPEVFSSVRDRVLLSVSSAGPLPPEGALAAHRAFGATPYEILGSTETGGIASRRRVVTENETVETPAWVPTPGMRVTLAREGEAVERPLQVGDEGLLALTSRQLHHPTELGADRIRITDVSPEGEVLGFTLLGRNDRILKVEGKRFSADALQKAVLTMAVAPSGEPLFSDVRALVTRREREETALVAVVRPEALPHLLKEGKRALLQRLRKGLLSSFEAVTLPRRLRIVSHLPVNAQAKVTLSALEALFDPRRPEWLTLFDRTDTATGVRTTCLTAEMRPDLLWFSGHFPELPLLPGVASLELVRQAAEMVRQADACVLSLRNLKFKSPVFPSERLLLTLTIKPRPIDAAEAADGAEADVSFLWQRPEKPLWDALYAARPEARQMAYDRLSQTAPVTAQGTLRLRFS